MARITGKNGSLKIGANVVAAITDWALDAKVPTADATAMGDQFDVKLSLIRGWSGSFKGMYGNAGEQIDALNSFFNATTDGGATSGKVTISLYPDAAATEVWVGDCYIETNLTVDKSKANSGSWKFTGTGALVRTPNP